MRFFPSAPRLRRALDRLPAWAHPQWLVTAVAVVVAVAGLAVPLAHADDRDDLKDRQNKVQGQISAVKDDIHEASARVAQISGKLRKAQGQLTAARARLTKVRGELADAREVATRLKKKLVAAEAKLVKAKADLKQAKIEVAEQREEGRDTLIRMSTEGNPELALLASYAEGDSLQEVMVNQTASGVITERQQQALDALEVVQELMAEREAAVREARNDVASAKKAADANVATISTLVDRAATTAATVSSLVSRTATARAAVVRARAADKAALRRLEAREARIKRKIIELSRKQGGSYNGSTNGLLARPGPGPVTSPYGWRTHPIYGYWGLHNGTDFGTGCGARLAAGESGTVINTYYDEVYGNRLYLAIGRVNGASIVLVYNHLSRYAVGQGARVKRGQTVGYSGSTGWSTGCHLHFIVLRNGNAVDPMPYL
ncbi:M23 family metallopeptidase [Nocardioides sp. J54]|uniref:M23 family metallopeptidase n=1 Tax=Nocardioides sp. J54 TaxID=935866 RepID=UPI00048A8239|nr:M23 family metallopeptidase [Nocardioides sp. J54]